jgi:hypothetical protein
MDGEIQQRHAILGEDLTRGLLAKRFIYEKRSIDVGGADFLVMKRVESIHELPERDGNAPLRGIVQSKFMGPNTTAYIPREYLIDKNQKALENFFLVCHGQDEQQEDIRHFFTASEIIEHFKVKDDEYVLYLGRSDSYVKFRQRKDREILDLIERGIEQATEVAKQENIKRLFFYHSGAGRSYGKDYLYLFRKMEGFGVVLTETTGHSGTIGLLELRRDIFKYFGTFSWGYRGTGVQFLAHCLLAHAYDGTPPDGNHVERLVEHLLQHLDESLEWDVSGILVRMITEGLVLPEGLIRMLCRKMDNTEERNEQHLRIKELFEKISSQSEEGQITCNCPPTDALISESERRWCWCYVFNLI